MAEVDPNVGDGAAPEPQEQVSKPIEDGVTKLLAKLEERLDSLEKQKDGLRDVQGNLDRAQSDFKKRLAEYDRLVKKGYEPDEAIAELDNKSQQHSVLQDIQNQLADLAKRVNGNGNAANVSQDVIKAFAQFELDVKDPRVVLAMQKRYDSAEAAELAAWKLHKEISNSPNPNPAQSPSSPAPTSGTVNVADLVAESEVLMKNPSQNFERIMQIQDELKKAGVKS